MEEEREGRIGTRVIGGKWEEWGGEERRVPS